MNKEKVVVLTGSFNPPTKAHLRALVEAMNKTGAVKGYFVPVSSEYVQRKMLKHGDSIVIPDDKRIAMLQSLAETDRRIEISDFEISGKGDSVYTYNTICEIQRLNPDKEICYLAGADKLRGLSKWHNREEFLTNYRVLVFNRNDFDSEALIEKDPFLCRYKESFVIFDKISDDADVSEISATKIRDLFRVGNLEYKHYLTDGVAEIMETMDPRDFPEFSFEDWVRIMRTSPDRHTNQRIFKKVYEDNKRIISSIEGLDALISKARVYNAPVEITDTRSLYHTMIGCMNSDIIDAARLLKQIGANPAIICSSCGTNPADFYASGDMMSKLSENDICRRSSLSSYLYQFGNPRKKAVKESGVKLRGNMYPLNECFGGIYSPDVKFFREGFKKNFAMMDQPFSCAVVSAVPFNFIQNDSDDLKYRLDDTQLTDEGRKIMQSKIKNALSIALINGHDSVVIDDFGVRSGRLPQNEIASIFSTVLADQKFAEKFKNIVFAFDEGKRSTTYAYLEKSKYSEFYKLFGPINTDSISI